MAASLQTYSNANDLVNLKLQIYDIRRLTRENPVFSDCFHAEFLIPLAAKLVRFAACLSARNVYTFLDKKVSFLIRSGLEKNYFGSSLV